MHTTTRQPWHQRFAFLCISAVLGLALVPASTGQAATSWSFVS